MLKNLMSSAVRLGIAIGWFRCQVKALADGGIGLLFVAKGERQISVTTTGVYAATKTPNLNIVPRTRTNRT